jgi:hypothetical protein
VHSLLAHCSYRTTQKSLGSTTDTSLLHNISKLNGVICYHFTTKHLPALVINPNREMFFMVVVGLYGASTEQVWKYMKSITIFARSLNLIICKTAGDIWKKCIEHNPCALLPYKNFSRNISCFDKYLANYARDARRNI